MIVAGLVLLAVGLADLVRQFAPRRWRWVVSAAIAVVFVALSAGMDAAAAALFALAVTAAWVVVSPVDGSARAGLWPSALVALVATGSVALAAPRANAGPLGDLWPAASPLGALSPDAAVLALGALVFLLESANIVVRTALRVRPVVGAAATPSAALPVAAAPPAFPDAESPDAESPDAESPDAEQGTTPVGASSTAVSGTPTSPPLRGGRLIGPLERILVFALTLSGAFTLIAAVFAAKGIVRFPEISQDGEHGGRAEYFLVGSLVSWVTALAAAFLVWWGSN